MSTATATKIDERDLIGESMAILDALDDLICAVGTANSAWAVGCFTFSPTSAIV